jgi:aminoglycoside phosphotransferase (APT) family kinase protein
MAAIQQRDLAETRRSLRDWLNRRLPQVDEIEISELRVPASSGFSNETFLFDVSWVEAGTLHKHNLVARTQVPGPGLHPTYDVLLQATVMETLESRTDIPVPKVLWKESDASVLGTPFFVMERIDGMVPPDDPPYTAQGWVLGLEPAQRRTLYDNGLRMLARVHELDCYELGLGFLERSDAGHNPLERELSYCERYYAFATEGAEYPTLEGGFEWIQANRPTGVEPVVLNWGDGRIGNMMFAPDLNVVACLDWELASLGSPERDLGHWLFQDRIFTDGRDLQALEGFPHHDEVVAQYEVYAGRAVQNMRFYESLAALRSSMFYARHAAMLVAAGVLPPDSDLGQNNPASRILAEMVGLPAPVSGRRR